MAVNTGVDMSIYLKILEAEQRKELKDYEEEKYTSPLGQRNLGIFNTSLAITGTIQESRDNYLLKKSYKKGIFVDKDGNLSKHDAYERSGDPGFLGIWEKDLKQVTEHPTYGSLMVDKDGNPLDFEQAVLFQKIESGNMEEYSGQTVTNPVSGEQFDWNKHDASKAEELKKSYTEDEYKKETSYSESERALLGLEDNYVDPEESDAEVLEKLNEIEAEAKANQMDYDTAITQSKKNVIGASDKDNSQTEVAEAIYIDGGDPTELLENTGIDRNIQVDGGILIGGDTTNPIDKLNADVAVKVSREGLTTTKDMDPEFRLNKVLQEGLTEGELEKYLNLEGNEDMKRIHIANNVEGKAQRRDAVQKEVSEMMSDEKSDLMDEKKVKKDAQRELEVLESGNKMAANAQADKDAMRNKTGYESEEDYYNIGNLYEKEPHDFFGNEDNLTPDELDAKSVEYYDDAAKEMVSGEDPSYGSFRVTDLLEEREDDRKRVAFAKENKAAYNEVTSRYKGKDLTHDYGSLEGFEGTDSQTGDAFAHAGQRNKAYDELVNQRQTQFKVDNPDWDTDDWDVESFDFDTAPKTGNSFKKLINRMSQLFKPKPAI